MGQKASSQSQAITGMPVIKELSVDELYNTLADTSSFHQLLDCRCDTAFQTAHIDSAQSLGSFDFHGARFTSFIFYASAENQADKAIVAAIKKNASLLQNKVLYVVKGGMQAFKQSYPFLCSDWHAYSRGATFPSRIESSVYISGLGVATNVDVLVKLGITHIVNCTADCPFPAESEFPDHATYLAGLKRLRVPVIDSQDVDIAVYFPELIAFVDSAFGGVEPAQIGTVLFYCKHGQSRSATCLLAWMIHCKRNTEGGKLDALLRYVKEKRPKIRPNPGFLRQLQLFQENGSQTNTTDLNDS